MRDEDLKKIANKLKSQFFSYFKDDAILAVSEDKAVLPFAFLIKESKDILLLSFALDSHPSVVANFTLLSNSVKPVFIAENFYISQSGSTYFGEEADKMFAIDNLIDLEGLTAISEVVN